MPTWEGSGQPLFAGQLGLGAEIRRGGGVAEQARAAARSQMSRGMAGVVRRARVLAGGEAEGGRSAGRGESRPQGRRVRRLLRSAARGAWQEAEGERLVLHRGGGGGAQRRLAPPPEIVRFGFDVLPGRGEWHFDAETGPEEQGPEWIASLVSQMSAWPETRSRLDAVPGAVVEGAC